MNEQLVIAGKSCQSRLLVGIGKHNDFTEIRAAIVTSGAEIVKVCETDLAQKHCTTDFPIRFTLGMMNKWL